MPTYLIGLPVTSLADRAAPPRASPSILVRMTPSRLSRLLNDSAVRTASWPVIASSTRKMLAGWVDLSMSSSSCMSGSSMASRPAVSKMTTSRPFCAAFSTALLQMSTGSDPSIEKTGMPSWPPSVFS